MEVFERQLPANRVESPATLSASVRLFCQNNGYEIESLELRSDVYYIRLRRPRQDANDNPAGSSYRPSGSASSGQKSA
ncbi:hypothetical protein F5B18DRAFT_122755 [Nemania serpens]|nr:hypothetical protein F5B18DRAFT_122755 [Nemania serpens]